MKSANTIQDFLFFSNLTTPAMNNQISDTNLFELNEQSAEPLTLTEPSPNTLISPATDNNMNTLQSEEKLPTKTLALRAHENKDELSYNPHTIRKFAHKIIILSQDFLTSLKEKGDTNTSPQNTTADVPKTQPNMQQTLMNKLTAEKIGHITKFCRSKHAFQNKQSSRANQRTHLHQ